MTDSDHGTAVGSIIAGHNDGQGITGIASDVQLFAAFDGVPNAVQNQGQYATSMSNALTLASNAVDPYGVICVSEGFAPSFTDLETQVTTTVQLPITYNITIYQQIQMALDQNFDRTFDEG